MSITVATAAIPLYAVIDKDGNATSGNFAPTEVERQAVAFVLNQALQAVAEIAPVRTFAKEKRLRVRPPETRVINTDSHGKITSIATTGLPTVSPTHVSSSGGFLQFVLGGDTSTRVGDRVLCSGGAGTYQGYHTITARSSDGLTLTTGTASSVALTANVCTLTIVLYAWMAGCTVSGDALDDDAGNRLSRDMTHFLDDQDSNYPLSSGSITIEHDRELLPERARGILAGPKYRVVDGTTGAVCWTEKDGEDTGSRIYLRWAPLAASDPQQMLVYWLYCSPEPLTADDVDSNNTAPWNAALPLQVPAGFYESMLIPIAGQHLTRLIKFTGDETASQEGVLAEFYRQYQEAASRLSEWMPDQRPDELQTILI
jgi:hypothetical protein